MELGAEITITSETGFLLRSTEAIFQIAEKIARGRNGVSGIAPFGKFTANNFNIDVEREIITLESNVKINFDPNKPLNIFNSDVATTVEGNAN